MTEENTAADEPAAPDVNDQLHELRRSAAEWIAIVRDRITDLTQLVSQVRDAAEVPGSLLGQVLNAQSLRDVSLDLDNADSAATSLSVECSGLPLPDLLRQQKILAAQLALTQT